MTHHSRGITLLRIHTTASHVSAGVFEHVFRNHIGSMFTTSYMTSRDFAALAVHGQDLGNALGAYDYICPDYTVMPLTPWLMQWRNRHNLTFGILFIAHSPGIYGLEWYLMQGEIRPNDIIIAPGDFAAEVIRLLAPSLDPYIEVIPHPLAAKKSTKKEPVRGNTMVTLSRVVEDKLIHRQIDAMAKVVHAYGYRDLTMVIGGRLTDPETGELTAYARLLYFKINRLKLEAHVFLKGEIGEKEKHDFFNHAFVSINLSKTIEETFPKASVEALGYGIPVIATRWSGFKDIVGEAGHLLDVSIDAYGRGDVDGDELARAIIRLYENPVPGKICHNRIRRFDAAILGETYRKAVTARVSGDRPVAFDVPCDAGLLDTLAFLKVFSRSELMNYHATWASHYLDDLRRGLKKTVRTPEMFFRYFVTEALRKQLVLFYAFKDEPIPASLPVTVADGVDESVDFHGKMRQCIFLSDNVHSRQTLLTIFANRPAPDLLAEAIDHFKHRDGHVPMGAYYLPFSDFLNGNPEKVCDFYAHHFEDLTPSLNQSDRLCLWAKAALQCHDVSTVTAFMARWLDCYMTEPEALPVHVAYMKLLLHHPGTPGKTVEHQLDIVSSLSFDRDLVQHLEGLSYAR